MTFSSHIVNYKYLKITDNIEYFIEKKNTYMVKKNLL